MGVLLKNRRSCEIRCKKKSHEKKRKNIAKMTYLEQCKGNLRNAKLVKSWEPRKILTNAPTLAIRGLVTEENEPNVLCFMY